MKKIIEFLFRKHVDYIKLNLGYIYPFLTVFITTDAFVKGNWIAGLVCLPATIAAIVYGFIQIGFIKNHSCRSVLVDLGQFTFTKDTIHDDLGITREHLDKLQEVFNAEAELEMKNLAGEYINPIKLARRTFLKIDGNNIDHLALLCFASVIVGAFKVDPNVGAKLLFPNRVETKDKIKDKVNRLLEKIRDTKMPESKKKGDGNIYEDLDI